MSALNFERLWPYGVGLLATAIWFFALKTTFPREPAGLLSATGTAAAVLVGFLATMNAIILSITGSEVFKAIRAAGYHHELFRYVHEATLGSMSLLILSVIGFFVRYSGDGWLIYKALWILTASISLSQFIRVSNLTFKLMKRV